MDATDLPEVRTAIDRWDSLLASRHFASTVEHLRDGTAARGLQWEGRPECSTLRPHFISAPRYAHTVIAAEATMRGLRRVFELVRERPPQRIRLALGPVLEELCAIDLDDPLTSGLLGRLDGFFGTHGILRFIEFNAFPGGPASTHMVAELFEGMPIFEEMSRDFLMRTERTLDVLIEALASTYSTQVRSGLPAIAYALCHPDDGFKTAGPEMPHLAARIVAAGGYATFAAPEEFAISDGRLTCRGVPIDVVGCDDHERLALTYGTSHPMFVAARQRIVRFVNGLAHAWMLASKGAFALLTDDTYAAHFDPDLWRMLQRHLPWTRLVEDADASYRGRRTGLLDLIADDRARWVLKPVLKTGGAGVVLGRESTPEEWESAIRTALSEPYVVQERVDVPGERFPVVRDGRLESVPFHYDTNPFIWNNTTARGLFTRLSSSAILNMATGASMTPVFVVTSR